MGRFVDANVFVYVLAADPHYGSRAREILRAIERGEEAVTSTLVLAQVCGYLRWRKRSNVIPLFISSVLDMPSLSICDTRSTDFERAMHIQAELGLPWRMWDDTVIAAQMERLGVHEIYSNDEDFDRIPWVRRVF